MAKIIRKVGGWLLAGLLAVRWIVDLLESIKATKHYADFLYSHGYSAFGLLPKSVLFDIGLLTVGLGLIFSDRLLKYVDRWWPRAPNIQFHTALNAGVTWDDRNGCYIRKPNLEYPRIAIILEIANEVEQGKASPSAGRVKAQITYRYADKGRSELRVVPAAWIDEPLSSVKLDCGDTRWLVAAVGFQYTQDWRVPVNRRSDITNPQSFDHHDIFGWSDTQGTMSIDLISMDTNRILTTFNFDWRWTTGYPLALIRYRGTKDS